MPRVWPTEPPRFGDAMKRRPALSPAESFTAWLVASVGPDHDAHAALDSILSLLTTRELAAIAGGLSRA